MVANDCMHVTITVAVVGLWCKDGMKDALGVLGPTGQAWILGRQGAQATVGPQQLADPHWQLLFLH